MHTMARTLCRSLLALLVLGLVAGPCPWAAAEPAKATRTVYVAGNLTDEGLVVLTSAVAATTPGAVVLADSPACTPHNKAFLARYRAERVIPVGSFPAGVADLEARLGVKVGAPIACTGGPPTDLWRVLFPRVENVVVCPAEPRGQLLQAACLAGVVRAPLYVLHDGPGDVEALRRQLAAWRPGKMFAAGSASRVCRHVPGTEVVTLHDEKAVAAAYLRRQITTGPVRNLVVANPSDAAHGWAHLSVLAPWAALQRRAFLVLTDDHGQNVKAAVQEALKHRALERADALILLADLQAIPMEERPNPIREGKDPKIEMEPLTPAGPEPFSFATGRLFHDDPGVVALLLARPRLVAGDAGPRKALVVSNPGGGLPLLETFSRNTAKELRNRGFQTTTLFGNEVNKDDLRRLLPDQDIFLWEGHHSVMVKDYHLPEWTEPLRPSIIFLQSCLALEAKAQPLLERGGLGVIGSSTRTYSASGGACALAFFNALLYEEQSVGGSLRHAKNFLLAFSLLKEKRLGKAARLGGANVRSAWAFSLWGDPTIKLDLPDRPENALPPVRHEVHGRTVVFKLPDAAHEKVISERYQAQIRANERLVGLLRKDGDDEGHKLVPLVFAEVKLPRAPAGLVPHLHSRLPGSRWVFCWDGRRRCGYLLAMPRAKDKEELRFHVEWGPAEELKVQAPAAFAREQTAANY